MKKKEEKKGKERDVSSGTTGKEHEMKERKIERGFECGKRMYVMEKTKWK